MMRAIFTHLIGPRKGEREEFDEGRISVGRAANNLLCLGESARRVSSHHAEIIRRGRGYVLQDLGSTNGTTINGRRVVISELEPDDLIEFGAGGPLLRFGILRDSTEDLIDTVDKHQPNTDRVLSIAVASGDASRHRTLKNNAALIGALAAAMFLGGIAGIVGSSRLRTSDPETMSFAEVAELNSPAVVFIRTEFELLDSSGQVTMTEARTGSGFVVSASGLIVTNRHLIRDWEYTPLPPGMTPRVTRIEVILPHQKRDDAAPAEVYKLGSDKSVDVAILKMEPLNPTIVHGVEPDISHTNQGDEVVIIGYPLGLDLLQMTNDTRIDPSLSTGVVSRVGQDFIQLNLRAYHGNSGGPVLNRRGEAIGILTANVGSAQDIALCTPIGAALTLLKDELSYRTDSSQTSNERD